ncbi:MAG TPA: N-acetyldiaminopimelate deacetylase [Lactobacillus sp.]|nr:N-acetyldiaminopimelate deacetylase [Lactobacillus sp.]
MAETLDLIHIRRHLHQIPELALHEKETSAYLRQVIAGMPQQWVTIHGISSLPTALMVKVHGSEPKRCIGYRTDIDALPITEATGLPYASTHPGKMHACGHDIHMTVALGVLNYFTEHQPKDDLLFFFQPAEENDNGGKLAYEAGAFTGEWRPDEFYGLHVNPELPAGVIGCRNGTLFAGTTEINVDFIGKGGHAAYPHLANDMVVACASFIMQAQTIVSRSVDPIEGGVVTFGKLQAGSIRNVIAGTARLEGTIRGLTQKMIEHIDQRLQAIANGIAVSFDCEVNVGFNQGGYLPVENDPKLTVPFIQFMKQSPDVTFVETAPAMTGEDFGYMLHQFPGTMFWLGVDGHAPLHSANMKPDESAIGKGVIAITEFLENRMQA